MDAYIVIPNGFVSSLRYLEPVGIEVVIKTESETEAIVLKSILKSYENYVLAVQLNASGLYDICKESGMLKSDNGKLNMFATWNLINMTLGKEEYFKYTELDSENVGLVNHYIYVLVFTALFALFILAATGISLHLAATRSITSTINTRIPTVRIFSFFVLLL